MSEGTWRCLTCGRVRDVGESLRACLGCGKSTWSYGDDTLNPKQYSELVSSMQDPVGLKDLCKELLDGADKCSRAPYYIVQPFLGIIKQHMETIKKYELM